MYSRLKTKFLPIFLGGILLCLLAFSSNAFGDSTFKNVSDYYNYDSFVEALTAELCEQDQFCKTSKDKKLIISQISKSMYNEMQMTFYKDFSKKEVEYLNILFSSNVMNKLKNFKGRFYKNEENKKIFSMLIEKTKKNYSPSTLRK